MIGLGSDKNWSPPPQPKRAMPIWRQYISKRGLPIKGSHSWLGMARKWSILDQKLAKHGRPVNVPKWSKKIQKGPKWSLMVPNDQKDFGWPFWSFLDPFGPLWSVDKPAMFGHFWSKMDHFQAIPSHERSTTGWKKAHHHVSYVWAACGTPLHTVWNINMAAIHEKCQK